MAKRLAEGQITREGRGIPEDNNEKPQGNSAPPEVMATRKILKPKGRNFQFSRKPDAGLDANFGSQIIPEGKAEKLKALANKFLSSIQQANLNQVIPDYRPIAQKYLHYYEEILVSQVLRSSTSKIEPSTEDRVNKSLNERAENPFANTAQKSIQNSEAFGASKVAEEPELGSEDEKKKDIQIQGPKFSMSTIPTTKKSAFSFGSTKATKKADPDSDSDSEIEIKGPSFTFTKEIKDPIFKLQQSLNNDKSLEAPGNKHTQEVSGTENMKSEANPSTTPASVSIESNHFAQPTIAPQAAPSGSKDDEISSSIQPEKSSQVATPAEEGETILFQVKAKLMLLKTEDAASPYQSIGIGELKVLKSEERGSLRVLIRAEGGLRLLLNALLIKDVEYTTLGNGSFIRFPALDDKHQIVTYVIKVGTAENGKKLCGILNSAKVN